MNATVALLVVAVAVLVPSEGYQMTRCQLVTQLRRQRFPESQMRNWVCLVEAESSRQTHVVNTNKNGSKDYGLFQINDQFWCSKTSKPGKDCNVTCADLIKDDITKASNCAKIIYNRHKFNAWYGWKSKCQGALPDISSCK